MTPLRSAALGLTAASFLFAGEPATAFVRTAAPPSHSMLVEVQAPSLAPTLAVPSRKKASRAAKSTKGTKGVKSAKAAKRSKKFVVTITSPVKASACIPARLRPGTGRKARLASVGTRDRTAIGTYVKGLERIYCQGRDDDVAWGLIETAARAKYRPAIRLLASEVATRPEMAAAKAKAYIAMFEAEARQKAAGPMVALGVLYERGIGVPADQTKAFAWFGRAAANRNKRALQRLAIAYATGLGKPADIERAKKQLAAMKDPEAAAQATAEIVVRLTDRATPDIDAIVQWNAFGTKTYPLFPHEMDRVFAAQMRRLGGTDREAVFLAAATRAEVPAALLQSARELLAAADPSETARAVGYLKSAAMRGDREAPRLLAQLAGDASAPDLNGPALAALKAASDAKNVPAMLAYAAVLDMPAQGSGSPEAAVAALKNAAAANDAEAQQRLAMTYLLTRSAPGDIRAAADLLKRASKNGSPVSALVRTDAASATPKPTR